MSVLNKVASVASMTAALLLLNQGVALADTPTTGHNGAVPGPTARCTHKPTHPNYPLERGSPSCCARPATWQVHYSGGLLHQPRHYYWTCVAPTRPPP